jgi:hypothetical protein
LVFGEGTIKPIVNAELVKLILSSKFILLINKHIDRVAFLLFAHYNQKKKLPIPAALFLS